MQASGAGRDWCEGLIARARKKITSQLHAYLNLRFGFGVFFFGFYVCECAHACMHVCSVVVAVLSVFLLFVYYKVLVHGF